MRPGRNCTMNGFKTSLASNLQRMISRLPSIPMFTLNTSIRLLQGCRSRSYPTLWLGIARSTVFPARIGTSSSEIGCGFKDLHEIQTNFYLRLGLPQRSQYLPLNLVRYWRRLLTRHLHSSNTPSINLLLNAPEPVGNPKMRLQRLN